MSLCVVPPGRGKHTNFELGTRVPIIIRDPDHAGGIVSNLLVESVDLCERASPDTRHPSL